MILNLRGQLHIREHNDPEPEDGNNAETDIRDVYEHIFCHNTTFVSDSNLEPLEIIVPLPLSLGKREKNTY
jgi:hypothetical protein